MTDTPQSPVFIQLDMTALEDLHTGSGTGSGDVDALIERDRQGRPVVRSSHLRGLLREAGEELLDYGQITSAELERLLGAQGDGRGQLQLTSARTGDGRPGIIWGSTKRVVGGRSPDPDTLRFVEHAPAGSEFVVRLRLPDAQLLSLLERLLRRVDRVGGDRNRGSGLIRSTWERRALPGGPGPEGKGKGTRLRLTLRNLEPLCLPLTGYPGNLIRTQSFIRGQTLLGGLGAWLIRTGRGAHLDLLRRVSVGDALPLPSGKSPVAAVVPIPLSVLNEKPRAAGADIPWWAADASEARAFDSLYDESDSDEKPKRPGVHEYLCRLEPKALWLRYTPNLTVRLRNATPKKGSADEANLFSLEEVAEDTCFQSELRFDDEPTATAFIEVFDPLLRATDWLALGRGGQPALVDGAVVSTAPEHESAGDDWSLTLTSDLIARGDHLGFLDDLELDQLCDWAGVTRGSDWSLERGVVETEAIHGFNGATGLRRAPALAIRRGSCWRVRGTGSEALAAALFAKGALGERTREGFGRFVIGLQPICGMQRPTSTSSRPERNAAEELLDTGRRLSKLVKGEKTPSLSQLQWLRAQALAADEQQLDQLLQAIESAPKDRPQGGKAWGAFGPLNLRDELAGLSGIEEKRLLIGGLVKWLVKEGKEKRG